MNKLVSAVGLGGLGIIILWSGVTNAGILNSLQSIFQGQKPVPGTPQAPFWDNAKINVGNLIGGASYQTNAGTTVAGNGSATGQQIASTALQYEGQPYVWGGHLPTTDGGRGWDCYGFVTYVLHNKLGYNLPNNTHSGYLEMLAWKGAVPVDKSQVQAGDIICWPTHSGIAVSSTEMISAENPSAGTKVATFANGGPLLPEPMTVLRVTGGGVNIA